MVLHAACETAWRRYHVWARLRPLRWGTAPPPDLAACGLAAPARWAHARFWTKGRHRRAGGGRPQVRWYSAKQQIRTNKIRHTTSDLGLALFLSVALSFRTRYSTFLSLQLSPSLVTTPRFRAYATFLFLCFILKPLPFSVLLILSFLAFSFSFPFHFSLSLSFSLCFSALSSCGSVFSGGVFSFLSLQLSHSLVLIHVGHTLLFPFCDLRFPSPPFFLSPDFLFFLSLVFGLFSFSRSLCFLLSPFFSLLCLSV